jgi:TolB protein
LLLKKSLVQDNQPLQLADEGFDARWSPDGKRLAFLRAANNLTNLWTVNAEGGNAKQLTTNGVAFGGFSLLPYNRLQTQDYQWSPDGQRLVYCAHRSGISNVWQINADGESETQLSDNSDNSSRFFNPTLSPDGKVLTWLSMSVAQDGQSKRVWSIWISEAGKSRKIFESESIIRITGWTPSSQELIVKSCASTTDPLVPTDVNLSALSIEGALRPLARLSETYFQNIQLSSDGKRIVYITRKDGTGSLKTISSTGGTAQTVFESNDSRLYFSGLSWSPDGKTIYYDKQASWSVISLIENFK